MMMSVDGRIDCPMVAQISGEEYYDALGKLGVSSKLSGRVTASLECAAVKSESPDSQPRGDMPAAESVNIARRSQEYTIIADTNGRLDFSGSEADGHPLLCILSGNVPEAHLEDLRKAGISWIATGDGAIDLPRAMDVLGDRFGVKRVVIVGGGHVNGGFLEAGLIDEISIMIAPGVDGRKGETAVFDGITSRGCSPFRFRLQSVERCEGTDVVWLRYKA